jgi:hypothetical protein
MGNIDDVEQKIRVGSLVMLLRFIFYWGLEAEILKENGFGYDTQVLDREFIEEICFNLVEFLREGEHNICQYSIYVILEIFMLVGKTSKFLREMGNM